jgi:hypothetical protein
MRTTLTLPLDGRSFAWDGDNWFGLDDYSLPPATIAARLDALLVQRLCQEDDALTDRRELLRRARDARSRRQYRRAERIVQRLAEREPDSPLLASLLCSILRESGRASEAVALADMFPGSDCAPLLTSRAAALCDLDRWAEALQQIRQVLARGRCVEAEAVHSRIQRYAPKRVLRAAASKKTAGAGAA